MRESGEVEQFPRVDPLERSSSVAPFKLRAHCARIGAPDERVQGVTLERRCQRVHPEGQSSGEDKEGLPAAFDSLERAGATVLESDLRPDGQISNGP